MGIVILPFLIGAFTIVVIAMINSVRLLNLETIGLIEIGFGLMISLALFGAIIISYLIEGKIWKLSPFFRVPIFAVFIPFVIHLVTKDIETLRFDYISNLLLVSIAITGILAIAFNYILFKLIEYFNIEKYY
ncbi:hypothetical protein KO529_22005 [Arenibacter algicola]|uniref:hypothetical protein n=1 Tax=Arenibacter algicola TaxID=616991 RepID=UPI001C06CF89|nr:hypothetical protein [Arenibacter algicola]MBU2907491.1 hypothetical protein [Arenibacter algicola]